MGLGAFVLLVFIAALVLGGMVRSKPRWYRAEPMTDEARRVAAKSLHDRLLALNNRVGDSIIESKQNATTQPRAVQIEISEEELNAVYQTWEVLPGLSDQMDQFVTDRRIRLLPDRIVLAGRMTRGGIVAGLHLVVTDDENGRPLLSLEGINAGLVHMPDSITDRAKMRMMINLENEVARRTARSKFDPPNDDAIRIVMARQLSRLVSGAPIQPMLVVQSGLGTGFVSEPAFARLESLEITDGKLIATLRPVSADEARNQARDLGIIPPDRVQKAR